MDDESRSSRDEGRSQTNDEGQMSNDESMPKSKSEREPVALFTVFDWQLIPPAGFLYDFIRFYTILWWQPRIDTNEH